MIQIEKSIQRSKEAEEIITRLLEKTEVKLINVFNFDDSLIIATAPLVYRLSFQTVQTVVRKQIISKVKEMLSQQTAKRVTFN